MNAKLEKQLKLKKNNYKDYRKYCETFHSMKYTGNGRSFVIARGKYLGMQFLVVNCRGQHPCGYVNAAGTKYDGKDYDSIWLDCHEGLTYSNKEFWLTGEVGWWLGWDYAHLNDKIEYGNAQLNKMHDHGQKMKSWTTATVVKECMNVIDQIKESK